ncbi:hypothetical protein HK104_002519, partial [Borealophlyctis nickersoniae]
MSEAVKNVLDELGIREYYDALIREKYNTLEKSKEIRIGTVAEEYRHIIPFESLPSCTTALKLLMEEERPIVVLHGPVFTGKTLHYISRRLAKDPNRITRFVDATAVDCHMDLSVSYFWRKLGYQILDRNDISSCEDAIAILREYN